MTLRIVAIAFIYICTTLAWVALGGTVTHRTEVQDSKLRYEVGRLWGAVQRQTAPELFYRTKTEKKMEHVKGGETTTETVTEWTSHPVSLSGGDVNADVRLQHRKKGLLWYATYTVDFTGKYILTNNTDQARDMNFLFRFPSSNAVYDNFSLMESGKAVRDVNIGSGGLTHTMYLASGESRSVTVHYRSQGMDQWWYSFGDSVSQVKNFNLTMTTDFDRIDFPDNGISPTEKKRIENGWELEWNYNNLLTGVQIGLELPKKLNPGPWVSQVTFSAPVSLFLFFFLLFVFTTIRDIRLHPMNYFFVGSAFFSFHLLLAYLVDHVSIHAAFFISSAVSVLLVTTYMRLVVGARFAFVEIGVAQFVYLVLFSYTFFFTGYTGLAITILCVVTLFIVMQVSGRVNWDEVFKRKPEPEFTFETPISPAPATAPPQT